MDYLLREIYMCHIHKYLKLFKITRVSTITHEDYTSQSQGLLQNVPIELTRKNILVDIEFVGTPLDYKILLGHC